MPRVDKGVLSSMSDEFDIIVVGAGILGVTSAYYLQKNNPGKDILLIDKMAAAGQANTAMSAAAVRNMFSSNTNQLLTDTSVNFIDHIQNEIGYDVTFEKVGYLWLLSKDQFDHPSVRRWIERMRGADIHCRVHEKDELKDKIPALNVDFEGDEEAELMNLEEVEYGLFGGDCGVLDPTSLVEFYLDKFKDISNVSPRFGVNVERLLLEAVPTLDLPGEPLVWQNKKVNGVVTDNTILRADTVVLATGAWSNELLDPIGMDGQTKAKKRQMFVVHSEDNEDLQSLLFTEGFNDMGVLPFTILPSAGVYFRPQVQEEGFWIGCGDKVGRPYHYIQPKPELAAEQAYYENSVYPVLSKYFPVFANSRPVNSWAGAYNYSPDRIPYVYKKHGVLVVNGASGSGIMKADAMGRICDALYRGEKEAQLYGDRSIPSDALRIDDRKVETEGVII
ncbi:MAG: FAD-dependent oxidoreductase [Candidatus Lokiarchaeota archaeon]|nr:FAD-dependent oxidoreductase [Candidatus Lokiarchaeota archaeon]